MSETEISRRGFLAGALGATLASSAGAAEVHKVAAAGRQGPAAGQSALPAAAAAPAKGPVLGKADIDKLMSEISNWNRWGKDDSMGTVNLITAAKRKQAASLVREGLSVSLSHAQDTEKSIDNTAPLIHLMTATGGGKGPVTFAFDTYTMNYHGLYYSHMDALGHCFYDQKLYNGLPADTVTTDGASKLDIAAFKDGILTRGVLMDIPRLKGVPYLEPGTPIYPEDLDAWEKQAKVKVSSGDMLFVRTGRWACRAERGPWSLGRNAAGLYAPCAKWLRQRDVAAVATDAICDVAPSRVEGVSNVVHALVLVGLGTPIFDNLDMEAAGEVANRLKRWEFMASAAPMVIPKGTGSPLNPIATF